MRRRHPLQPRQRLDAALRLLGLGGLGLEAGDKAFQVGDGALLLVECLLLLGQALGALVFKVAVIAGVGGQLAARHFDDLGGDGVQKLAVVRNQQQGARIAGQPLLQPDDGFQVQVVGRFIQQQQIRAAHQRLRQVQAHAPAARKAGHRSGGGFLAKAQAGQELAGARRGGVGVDGGQFAVQAANRLAIVGGFGGGQLLLQRAQLGVAIQHIIQRRAAQRRGFLGDMRHRPAGRKQRITAVGVQLPAQQGKQAGFARAIAADNADALAGVDGEGDAVEQLLGPTAQGQVFQLNHELRPESVERGEEDTGARLASGQRGRTENTPAGWASASRAAPA